MAELSIRESEPGLSKATGRRLEATPHHMAKAAYVLEPSADMTTAEKLAATPPAAEPASVAEGFTAEVAPAAVVAMVAAVVDRTSVIEVDRE